MYHYPKHCRLIDKERNETCNDFNGHGGECHAFCERRFEGRVKVPITRVLGGDRFDVVFEACVGNYWKRPEIMQWLWLVLPLPKSDSILWQSLYIILRSTEMIAQLRIGAIFFSFHYCSIALAFSQDTSVGASEMGQKAHGECFRLCLFEMPEA